MQEKEVGCKRQGAAVWRGMGTQAVLLPGNPPRLTFSPLSPQGGGSCACMDLTMDALDILASLLPSLLARSFLPLPKFILFFLFLYIPSS